MKTKWLFGYRGAKEHYWIMATSLRNMLKQVSDRGLAAPDWYEDTGYKS